LHEVVIAELLCRVQTSHANASAANAQAARKPFVLGLQRPLAGAARQLARALVSREPIIVGEEKADAGHAVKDAGIVLEFVVIVERLPARANRCGLGCALDITIDRLGAALGQVLNRYSIHELSSLAINSVL
jgi:hypothetical protein